MDNYAAGAGGTPLQVAALPYRLGPTGREVLLVTSRRSGRWIIPKGWPYHGASLIKSAAREAYEKYLQLAPDAKNAAEVRRKLERLKGQATD